jgi:hypothetical protein
MGDPPRGSLTGTENRLRHRFRPAASAAQLYCPRRPRYPRHVSVPEQAEVGDAHRSQGVSVPMVNGVGNGSEKGKLDVTSSSGSACARFAE